MPTGMQTGLCVAGNFSRNINHAAASASHNNRPHSSSTSHAAAPKGNVHFKASDLPIPKYKGASDDKTPYEFILQLEKFGSIAKYHEKQMLERIMRLALIEEAYSWYRLSANDALKRELESRTQAPDEPLSAYINIILSYYERLEELFTERDIVSRVCRQMHPIYRQSVVSKRIRSLHELKMAANEAQEPLKSFLSYKSPSSDYFIEPTLAWKASSSHQQHSQIPVDSGKVDMASVDPLEFFHQHNFASSILQQVSFADPLVMASTDQSHSSEGTHDQNSRFARINHRRFPASDRVICYECNMVVYYRWDCPKLLKRSEKDEPSSTKRQ